MVPVLILAPYAGVIADRVDKRRLIIGVQGVMAVLALILGVLTVTGAVRLWEVYVLAAGARHRDGLRQPDPAVVRDGDRRARPRPQRRHAQLRARERRARGRARPSRAS